MLSLIFKLSNIARNLGGGSRIPFRIRDKCVARGLPQRRGVISERDSGANNNDNSNYEGAHLLFGAKIRLVSLVSKTCTPLNLQV